MSRQLRLALFLGAGASVPYGKPITRKLKDELVIKYKRDDLAQRNQIVAIT